MMQGFLHEENSFGVFVLVTLILGGGAAWLTGRAIALTWRPWWQLAGYTLLLGVAVRFIHYALFKATFLSAYYYAIDTAICFAISLLGYGATRAHQMATQYHWLHKRTGPFSWGPR
jgi:GR25 family glycosyltransferase involved in LPS biosynthesis